MAQEKVLIVDDEVDNLSLLRMRLEAEKFEVFTAESGKEGIEKAKRLRPDIIILDVNMPGMDGFETCRRLKENIETAHIPVVMLTCLGTLDNKLRGLDGGADDYLVRDEIDYREISARLRSILRRASATISANPLTHLPGNVVIDREIKNRLEKGKSFTVGYTDIDNFKAYNDYYGFKNGDRVILFVARVLSEAIRIAGNPSDFLGHIGGDDFIFITTPDKGVDIANEALLAVRNGIGSFYSPEDREKGYIIGHNREGKIQKFPLISISIVLVTPDKYISDLDEISRVASILKKKVKEAGGDDFAVYPT